MYLIISITPKLFCETRVQWNTSRAVASGFPPTGRAKKKGGESTWIVPFFPSNRSSFNRESPFAPGLWLRGLSKKLGLIRASTLATFTAGGYGATDQHVLPLVFQFQMPEFACSAEHGVSELLLAAVPDDSCPA